MDIHNIAVVGVGGVGGYFGGKLCRLLKAGSGLNISFIARGEHLRAIELSGLLLSSEADGDVVCRPSLATDDFSRLPQLDLCLLCVKEFDLPSALAGLKPVIGDGTIVLPLLNGIDIHSRVRSVIHRGIVLPACVYVGTHIERPGKVTQKGGACRILFGPDPLSPDFAPGDILSLFEQASIKSDWTPEVQSEIWRKFIFICAFGLVTAAAEKTVGQVVQDATLSNQVRMIMGEVVALSKARGVNLPEDIVDLSFAKSKAFPFETKTSFQRDFERMDKRDERDLFAGTVMRMARETGIDVPATSALSSILNRRKPQ